MSNFFVKTDSFTPNQPSINMPENNSIPIDFDNAKNYFYDDASADNEPKPFSSDGLFFKRLSPNSNSVMVTGVADNSTTVVIPEITSHLHLKVTSIAHGAFARSKIHHVVLPSSLENIGRHAFEGSQLVSIVIPHNIKSIDGNAFSSCLLLEYVDLSKTRLTALPEALFKNAYNLKKVQLPDTLKKIGHECFAGCLSLAHFDAPASLEVIGSRAFLGSGIKQLNLSSAKNITDIKKDAFTECNKLESVASCEFLRNNIELLKDTPLYTQKADAYTGVKTVLDAVIEIAPPSFSYNGLYQLLPKNARTIESWAALNCNHTCIRIPKTVVLLKPNALVQPTEVLVINDNNIVTREQGFAIKLKLIYDGTIHEWFSIVKLSADKLYKVIVECSDGTFIDHI